MISFKLMKLVSEWVASNRILAFAQRFLGSPRGRHRKSLMAKSCFDVQKTILERDYRIFAAVSAEMDFINVNIREI